MFIICNTHYLGYQLPLLNQHSLSLLIIFYGASLHGSVVLNHTDYVSPSICFFLTEIYFYWVEEFSFIDSYQWKLPLST